MEELARVSETSTQSMEDKPLIPENLVDNYWQGIDLTHVRTTLTFIDELGMPVRRKGALIDLPKKYHTERDKIGFARAMGRLVEQAILEELEKESSE